MYGLFLFYGYEQTYVSGFTVTALFSPQAVYREAAHRADAALHSGSASWAKHVCSSFRSTLKYRYPLMAVRACAVGIRYRDHLIVFKFPHDPAYFTGTDKGAASCRAVTIMIVLSEHDSLLLSSCKKQLEEIKKPICMTSWRPPDPLFYFLLYHASQHMQQFFALSCFIIATACWVLAQESSFAANLTNTTVFQMVAVCLKKLYISLSSVIFLPVAHLCWRDLAFN